MRYLNDVVARLPLIVIGVGKRWRVRGRFGGIMCTGGRNIICCMGGRGCWRNLVVMSIMGIEDGGRIVGSVRGGRICSSGAIGPGWTTDWVVWLFNSAVEGQIIIKSWWPPKPNLGNTWEWFPGPHNPTWTMLESFERNRGQGHNWPHVLWPRFVSGHQAFLWTAPNRIWVSTNKWSEDRFVDSHVITFPDKRWCFNFLTA